MKRGDPQFKLRFPPEVKDLLDAASARNHRSLTAEVVARLERTFLAEAAASRVDLSGIAAADLLAELGRRCER